MNEQTLIESLAAACDSGVPAHADVIGLQQLSLDDLRARAERFLSQVKQEDECVHDRADWTIGDDHTLVHLADGARATVYHASGALQYVAGRAPLEALFARVEDKEQLTRMVNAAAEKLGIATWAGSQGQIAFERLFQMKAQGVDLKGQSSEPVLSRAIGAYRHYVDNIAVLGAASVAVKLAGDGQLDALTVMVRPTLSEIVDKANIIDTELAARQIAAHLSSLLGQAKDRLPADVIESQTMQFGYLDLGKRKAQRVLAPAFVAQIVLRHNVGRQAYVFAVSATEKPYMQFSQFGNEAVVARSRVGGTHDCKDVIR